MTQSYDDSAKNQQPQACTDSAFMARIDRLPRNWRELVHDFGWIIVRDMMRDGHRDATKLRDELDAWRERQQEAWLAEIPYRRSHVRL